MSEHTSSPPDLSALSARAIDLLSARLGWERGGIELVPLHQGLTNTSLLARAGDEAVVVRMNCDDGQAIGLDRLLECQILQQVTRAGIAPEVLLVSSDCLITRYIEGRTWNSSDLRHPESLLRVAMLLRQLHRLPPCGPPFDPLAVGNLYLHTAMDSGRKLPQGLPDMRRRLQRLCNSLSPNPHPRLCHLDLVAANLVEGQQLWLIDWEYAASADPLFDLASVTLGNELLPSEERLLLDAYTDGLSELIWERYTCVREIFALVNELWFVAAHRRPR